MWVGWNAIITVFVWCSESRQKCCQRQRIEIRHWKGRRSLLLLSLVGLVLENNVWFLDARWLYLSNCHTAVAFFWPVFTGIIIIWSPSAVSLKVMNVFYPFRVITASFVSLCFFSRHAVYSNVSNVLYIWTMIATLMFNLNACIFQMHGAAFDTARGGFYFYLSFFRALNFALCVLSICCFSYFLLG